MFATIGLIVCLLIAIKIVYHLCRLIRRKPFVWLTGDQWAVITGCTDGVGEEFARQLAHKGYHLMMISRSEHKLQNTKQKILGELVSSSKTVVQIRTHVADFSQVDIYESIGRFLDVTNNDIMILVNNIGMNSPRMPDYFCEEAKGFNEKLINANIMSNTCLTELVLPSMVLRKRGLVINISSLVGAHVTPMFSTYSATKAYILQLSQCLAAEYRSAGITFATFITAVVSTKMAYNLSTNTLIPSPEKYVRSCLNQIRYRDSFVSTGYYVHNAIHGLLSTLAMLFSADFVAQLILWFMSIIKQRIVKLKSMPDQPQQFSISMFFDKKYY